MIGQKDRSFCFDVERLGLNMNLGRDGTDCCLAHGRAFTVGITRAPGILTLILSDTPLGGIGYPATWLALTVLIM